MKASELKPGFRYAYSNSTSRALAESLDTCDIAVLKGVYCIRVICFEDLAEIEGDDWIQCAPQVPLSELKRYNLWPDKMAVTEDPDGNWLSYDEVFAVSPVSDERVRELEEERDELQRKFDLSLTRMVEVIGIEGISKMVEEWGERVTEILDSLDAPSVSDATTPCEAIKEVAEIIRKRLGDRMADHLIKLADCVESDLAYYKEIARTWFNADGTHEVLDSQQEAIDRRKAAAAELSTLRAQLEGQRLPQLPLKRIKQGTRYVAFATEKNGCYPKGTVDCGVWLAGDSDIDTDGWDYYRDPTPLPAPPSEPEPEVRWEQYQRTAVAEMSDWFPGFDMSSVSVSDADASAGSPKEGDKIARNPKNHNDKWLVAAEYFANNFAPIEPTQELLEALEKE